MDCAALAEASDDDETVPMINNGLAARIYKGRQSLAPPRSQVNYLLQGWLFESLLAQYDRRACSAISGS